jgi:antirestriction protein ArdC
MSKNAEVYAKTLEHVVSAMESGIVPWVRPWSDVKGGAIPHNAVTGRSYSGGNVLALWMAQMMHGYSSQGYVTFKQAIGAGCVVRKGSKGHHVYYMSTVERKDKVTGEKERFFFAKGFTVFNVDQLDELEAGALDALKNRHSGPMPSAFERIEAADAMVTATGADVRHGGNRAFYTPALDRIQMPEPGQFVSMPTYYGTLFHELGHWTGHESRLKRITPAKFGSPDYAFEELVAELCAAFLSAQFGWDTVSQSAAYLTNWAKACRAEPDLLAKAASLAAKAAELVSGPVVEVPEEVEA